MPEKTTVKRARRDAREGKTPSTQAGEFVREEMGHIRRGKHGARSPQQAIAIGLSKARRAGVKLPPPASGKTSPQTRAKAARDYEKGQHGTKSKPSPKRSRSRVEALRREGHQAANPQALARQARVSASRRGKTNRRKATRKAAQTKGAEGRREAAQKAAQTRRSRRGRQSS